MKTKLSKSKILLLLDKYNKTYKDKIALFSIGEEIRIVKNEPNLGNWTWMDDIRLERKGQKGIIIKRDIVETEKFSPFDYTIMFKDKRKITFVEEHLEKIKKKNE